MMRVVVHILIYSLFYIMDFILPASRPNFAAVAGTIPKVEQACCGLSHCLLTSFHQRLEGTNCLHLNVLHQP
jgi:hypothetical protein